MNKHIAIISLLVLGVAFIAFWVFGTNKAVAPTKNAAETSAKIASPSPSAATPSAAKTSTPDTACPAAENPTITYQNGEFSPRCVTVTSGTTVTWVNKDTQEVEIGADPHPAHTGNREVSSGEFVLPLSAGGQATSKLSTAGTHSYHNHVNSIASGTVIVK